MNEQVLKRMEELLRMESMVIEQLEELSWLIKDVLNDLILELNPGARPGDPGSERADQGAHV
jgi:hypothetical protein